MSADAGSPGFSAAEPTRLVLPNGLEAAPHAIGKYHVLERLGSGAMGVVYKCSQPDLDRPVAVKMLLSARHATADQLIRFQREARAAARLNHPNVVQVYDVGYENGLHYFVMEYVDGWPLDKLIGKPALTPPKALRILYHVARALQAAHEQGVIHRDVKPSNILVQRSGLPKLSDFGLAKLMADGRALSSSGDLIGTPRYMSPEQALCESSDVDARTDVYSLGAVMYEALCGQPPVDGPNAFAILRQLSEGEPVPLRQRNPEVPEAVAAVCHRALARNREDRYATAGQFADALQAYLLEKVRGPSPAAFPVALPLPAAPSRPRWPWWAKAALAFVTAGALAGALLAVLARPAHAPPAPAPDLSRLVAQAREQLDAPPPADGPSPRERLRGVVDDLTAVLTYDPGDAEARLLRARAFRRGGEHQAAIDDLNVVLEKRPDDPTALLERLLAAYELNILYLGNLQEPLLRPRERKAVAADVEAVRQGGARSEGHAAALADALARQDYDEAAKLAEEGWPVAEKARIPDWAMLEADAWFHGADAAFTAEQNADAEGKPALHVRREELVRRGDHALHVGLTADPNHVGLLFLKAAAVPRHAAWEAGDADDKAAARRNKTAFETACALLRRATLRTGSDTQLARAVLLANAERAEAALEQLSDALAGRRTPLYAHTFQTYLRLQTPPDGLLTPDDAEQLLRDLRPAFEAPPEEFNPWFVRALVRSAAGRWEDEARADLRECRQRLGADDLPTWVPAYAEWFRRAEGPSLEYQYATLDVLAGLSVAVDLRVRLGEDLLQRLGDGEAATKDGLEAGRVQQLQGLTHLFLAHTAAGAENRDDVLKHLRAALDLGVPDVTAETLQADGAFQAWNMDPEFVELYKKYQKPPDPPKTAPDPPKTDK